MGGGSTCVDRIARWRLAGTAVPSGGASDIIDFPLHSCFERAVVIYKVIMTIIWRRFKAWEVQAELMGAEGVRQTSVARTSLYSLH